MNKVYNGQISSQKKNMGKISDYLFGDPTMDINLLKVLRLLLTYCLPSFVLKTCPMPNLALFFCFPSTQSLAHNTNIYQKYIESSLVFNTLLNRTVWDTGLENVGSSSLLVYR